MHQPLVILTWHRYHQLLTCFLRNSSLENLCYMGSSFFFFSRFVCVFLQSSASQFSCPFACHIIHWAMSRKGILWGCCVQHVMAGITISLAQFSRNCEDSLHLDSLSSTEVLLSLLGICIHLCPSLEQYKGIQHYRCCMLFWGSK